MRAIFLIGENLGNHCGHSVCFILIACLSQIYCLFFFKGNSQLSFGIVILIVILNALYTFTFMFCPQLHVFCLSSIDDAM